MLYNLLTLSTCTTIKHKPSLQTECSLCTLAQSWWMYWLCNQKGGSCRQNNHVDDHKHAAPPALRLETWHCCGHSATKTKLTTWRFFFFQKKPNLWPVDQQLTGTHWEVLFVWIHSLFINADLEKKNAPKLEYHLKFFYTKTQIVVKIILNKV